MSTPISETPPRAPTSRKSSSNKNSKTMSHHHRMPTAELSEQMQRMIDLQHEQSAYGDDDGSGTPSMQTTTSRSTPKSQGDLNTIRTPFPSLRNTQMAADALQVSPTANHTHEIPSSQLPQHHSNFVTEQDSFVDPTVGKGTLFLNEALASSTSSLGRNRGGLAGFLNTGSDGDLILGASTSAIQSSGGDLAPESSPIHPFLSEASSATTALLSSATKRMPPLPSHIQSAIAATPTNTVNANMAAGFGSTANKNNQGYGAIPHFDQRSPPDGATALHHDFHYGNPDFPPHQPQQDRSIRMNRSSKNEHGCFYASCCCWVHPFVQLGRWLYHAESLHRSAVYGAIDGMLTGTGIVSTFCGMSLLSSGDKDEDAARDMALLYLVVLVFSASACFADSIGMAIGHVWTTYSMALSHASQRHEVRQIYQFTKADAKGQLVDILLSKGMLKIDAMSIADTLEGYPDLFVSTLAGESLIGGDDGGDHPMAHFETGGDVGYYGAIDQGDARHPGLSPQAQPPKVHGLAGPPREPFHDRPVTTDDEDARYGHHYDFPLEDVHRIRVATREARQESIVMIWSFTLASLLPATLLRWSIKLSRHDRGTETEWIRPTTLAVALACCIMWTLGVAKSRYTDPHHHRQLEDPPAASKGTETNRPVPAPTTSTSLHWFVFGMETVVVFLVCMCAAYGVGYSLSALLLENRAQLTITG